MMRDMEDMRAEPESCFMKYHREKTPSFRWYEQPDASVNRGEFRVDFREHDEDVIVVADLPGVNKESAALQLVNPRFLEIT